MIKLSGIIDEDFINYKKPSMVLMFPYCTFKCGKDVCQNAKIADAKIIEVNPEDLCARYLHNSIVDAIVLQGLEPMDSFDDVVELLEAIRNQFNIDSDVVIYTGYYKDEIKDKLEILSKYKNIVMKYGRYVPRDTLHFDDVLGVWLSSNNQYGERL